MGLAGGDEWPSNETLSRDQDFREGKSGIVEDGYACIVIARPYSLIGVYRGCLVALMDLHGEPILRRLERKRYSGV